MLFQEDAGGSAAAASGGGAAEPQGEQEAAAEDRGECARALYDYQAGTCGVFVILKQ